MADIRALLNCSDEETLAASGVLGYRFPQSIATSLTAGKGNEA